MDQELVQYLEERFERQEQRLNARFDRIEQRLDGHDQRFEQIDRRFERIDQRFEQIDRRFEGVDRRFDEVNERIEEVKRHSGVLVEGLRHELHLVAEGLTMHIQVQHVQEREYFDRKFEETHALIRSSYDHLRQRVENLEQRGQS